MQIELGVIDSNTVITTWLNECMSRLKMEVIFRLAEAPAVQQWLEAERKRALSLKQHRVGGSADSDSEADCREPTISEKLFLLTTALQIVTNPSKLPEDLTGLDYLKGWIGNQYLCQLTHNRKLRFCQVNWMQYEEEEQPEDPRDRWAPFGDGPATLLLDDELAW